MVRIRSRTPFHRQPVFRVLQLQLAVAVAAAIIGAGFFGIVAGYSALAGGLIAFVANLYFALKAFRYAGARSTGAIVRSLWSGEMGKQILTAALFALVFAGVRPLEPLALFAGFLLVLAMGASALLLMKKNLRH